MYRWLTVIHYPVKLGCDAPSEFGQENFAFVGKYFPSYFFPFICFCIDIHESVHLHK